MNVVSFAIRSPFLNCTFRSEDYEYKHAITDIKKKMILNQNGMVWHDDVNSIDWIGWKYPGGWDMKRLSHAANSHEDIERLQHLAVYHLCEIVSDRFISIKDEFSYFVAQWIRGRLFHDPEIIEFLDVLLSTSEIIIGAARCKPTSALRHDNREEYSSEYMIPTNREDLRDVYNLTTVSLEDELNRTTTTAECNFTDEAVADVNITNSDEDDEYGGDRNGRELNTASFIHPQMDWDNE